MAFRERIEESALLRLSTAALGSVGVSIVSLLYTATFHEVPYSLLVGIVGAGGFCLVVYLMVRQDKIPRSHVSHVGTAMFAIAVVLLAWAYRRTESTGFALIICLLMFVAGLMHLYRLWVLANLSMALAIWIPVGFITAGAEFATTALALGLVAVLSMMFHEVMMGYLEKLEELRVRELEHERERQQLREQLWHSQKLESVGTLAGGVAHDMNNALAAVLGLGELVCDRVHGEVRDDVIQLLLAARRGADLTRNLLAFSRRGAHRTEVLEVKAVVDSVARLLQPTLSKQITLGVCHGAVQQIEGDASQLTHALVNLCLNAADAMAGAGRLTVTTGTHVLDKPTAAGLSVEPGTYNTIAVTDDGCGMPPAVQARIFEPFFTMKASGVGTGLGLAMVHGTVQSHRGAISIRSAVGEGTTMTLHLPATERLPELVVAETLSVGSGRVLVIDDEPIVREVTRRCMERAGYTVEVAANGSEGYERFSSVGGFDLVLLDMAMPVMNGAQCFEKLRALDPRVKVVIVSGYADEDEAKTCLERGALAFIDKPYGRKELLEVVARHI